MKNICSRVALTYLDDAELTGDLQKFGTIASAKVAIDRETEQKQSDSACVDMLQCRRKLRDRDRKPETTFHWEEPLVVKAAEERLRTSLRVAVDRKREFRPRPRRRRKQVSIGGKPRFTNNREFGSGRY